MSGNQSDSTVGGVIGTDLDERAGLRRGAIEK
jgi:hypothetical protein